MIFIALRRITPDIFYFKSKGGRKVDFILQRQDRSRMLVQVCETMVDSKTRKREITALTEAMNKLKIGTGFIVTQNEEETVKVRSGNIEIIPAWHFLLSLADTAEKT